MKYVTRDAGGRVTGVFNHRQVQANGVDLCDPAPLADDDAEILAFAVAPRGPRAATLELAKVEQLAKLAHRRWLAEQEFAWAGMSLALDDNTQRRIAGAIQYLELADPEHADSVRWQVSRGVFATFTLGQLQALGVAAGAHVQACFANVETLASAIEQAGDFDTLEAVDLEQGWP